MNLTALNVLAPRVLPPAWRRRTDFAGAACYTRKGGIRVLMSVDVFRGTEWLHISVARRHRLPSWAELREVKNLFIGRDTLAVQVMPPEAQYVNEHEYCLHLWHRIDGPTLPGWDPE